MKYFFTFLLYLLSLSCAFSTGYPEIKIKLTPVAVNQSGHVLFAVKSLNNPIGSNNIYRYDFGWLIVNNDGLWDERVAFRSPQSDKSNTPLYKKYVDGKFNLKQPDEILKKMMKQYNFQSDSKLKKESWVVAIKPHQTCFQGKCIDKSLKQKTLGKVSSTLLHTPVRSSFYYKGVALFNNIYETGRINEVDKKEQGSSFNFEQEQIVFNGEKYPRRHPHSYIDGLVLFNPNPFNGNNYSNHLDARFKECGLNKANNKTYTSGDNHWEICQSDTKTKIFRITHAKRDTKYTELYFVSNGTLVYALEREAGIKSESIWDVKYRITNGKHAQVISSLGHGKTENDNWDPNSILGMYKKRMEELKSIKE